MVSSLRVIESRITEAHIHATRHRTCHHIIVQLYQLLPALLTSPSCFDEEVVRQLIMKWQPSFSVHESNLTSSSQGSCLHFTFAFMPLFDNIGGGRLQPCSALTLHLLQQKIFLLLWKSADVQLQYHALYPRSSKRSPCTTRAIQPGRNLRAGLYTKTPLRMTSLNTDQAPAQPVSNSTPSQEVALRYEDTSKASQPSSNVTQLSVNHKRKLSDASASPWYDTVLLLVGPDEYMMTVHSYIIRKIPFFRDCLDASMQESHSRTIRLPEDDHTAFGDLIHWAYTGRFQYDLEEQALDETPFMETCRAVKAYAVAQKYLAEALQNYVVDRFCAVFKTLCPSEGSLKELINLIDPCDSLYQLFMQAFSEEVAGRGGWLAIKQSQDAEKARYFTNFAQQDIAYMEFALDSLVKYPDGKRDETYADFLPSCTWHTHLVTPKCQQAEDDK